MPAEEQSSVRKLEVRITAKSRPVGERLTASSKFQGLRVWVTVPYPAGIARPKSAAEVLQRNLKRYLARALANTRNIGPPPWVL